MMLRLKVPYLLLSLTLLLTSPMHNLNGGDGVGVVDAFVVSVADDQEIDVIANPHDNQRTNSCPSGVGGSSLLLDKLLEPNQLIVTPMATQTDTFQKLSHSKIFGVPIPVYSVKQPARLSESQLEFQLVLVRELGGRTNGLIQEVPFPMEKAMDSWFPGYYWSPLVMKCSNNDNNNNSIWQHVGWKFTSLSEDNQYPHFYALMVQTDQKQKTNGLRVGGFKAPGWMVAAVLS